MFSLGAWLAGVWLVFGWCLAVVAGGWAREPGPQAPRPQLHWLDGASGGCLREGPTSTMAKGYNTTRHWMWHCPVMLVTAMLLTAAVASAAGAIRLCASAACAPDFRRTVPRAWRIRGAGPGGSTPPGALALAYRPALHPARLANKQSELGEHKHRTRTPSTNTNVNTETHGAVRERALLAERGD